MILFFGDVHGKFKHVLPAVQKHKPTAVIFLGYMELSRPFEQEVAEVIKLTELYSGHRERLGFKVHGVGFCGISD